MTNRINKRIVSTGQAKVIFWSLIFVLFFSLFSYGYLVRGAIVDIVLRQTMERQISLTSTKVLELESEYIKAKNNISLGTAQNLGFVAVSSQKFVSEDLSDRPGLSLVQTTN
jgi:hypothetical protein